MRGEIKNAPSAKDVGAARANHFSPNCAGPPIGDCHAPVFAAEWRPWSASASSSLSSCWPAASRFAPPTVRPSLPPTAPPCHGLDGKARTPAGKKLGAKDLSESKIADDAIVHQIGEGLKDKKGAERMPSFKARLAAEEIAALVAVVKAFRR